MVDRKVWEHQAQGRNMYWMGYESITGHRAHAFTHLYLGVVLSKRPADILRDELKPENAKTQGEHEKLSTGNQQPWSGELANLPTAPASTF